MEVSFLKDAINRIAEMAQPFVMEVDGRKYCSANMCEVEGQGEKPLPYRVDTLDALIQLIRTEGVKTYEKLFVRVKDPHTVVVDSGYITTSREFYDRASLYQAVTDVPPVTYGRAMDAERAVIELQSLYAATRDRDYLLALLSHIDTSQGVSTIKRPWKYWPTMTTGTKLHKPKNWALCSANILCRTAGALLLWWMKKANANILQHRACRTIPGKRSGIMQRGNAWFLQLVIKKA